VPVHRALFAHLTVGRIRVGVDPRMHWVETGLSHQDHVRRLQAGFIDSAGRPGIDSGLVSSQIGVPAWSPDSGTASAALNVMVESIRRDPEIPAPGVQGRCPGPRGSYAGIVSAEQPAWFPCSSNVCSH
jgi:hypothetical protein